MGLAGLQLYFLVFVTFSCSYGISTALAIASCDRLALNVSIGGKPALVFNPAFVRNNGLIMGFANAAKCHFWSCGLGHHLPLALLPGRNRTQGLTSELWRFDSGALPFREACPHLLAKGTGSHCNDKPSTTDGQPLALHAEDFRPFVWHGQLLVAHTVMLIPMGGRPVAALSTVDRPARTLRLMHVFADVYDQPQDSSVGSGGGGGGGGGNGGSGDDQSGTGSSDGKVPPQPLLLPQEARWQKNWGFFAHGRRLLVLQQLLPCTTVLQYEPHTKPGYRVESSLRYSLWKLPGDVPPHVSAQSDWRLSGHPVTRWRTGELLVMAHVVSEPPQEELNFEHAKYYDHYAFRVSTDTWRVTHMSSHALLSARRDYNEEQLGSWAFPGAVVIGSYHVITRSGGAHGVSIGGVGSSDTGGGGWGDVGGASATNGSPDGSAGVEDGGADGSAGEAAGEELLMFVGEGDTHACAKRVDLGAVEWLALEGSEYQPATPGYPGPLAQPSAAAAAEAGADRNNSTPPPCAMCTRLAKEQWEPQYASQRHHA